MGIFGLSPSEFYNLTPKETGLISDAYYNNEKTFSRERWELARYNAYFGLLPHQKKGGKLKVTDLGYFEWETLPQSEKDKGILSDKDFEYLTKLGNAKPTRILEDKEVNEVWH